MIRTIEQFDKQVAKCTKALNAKLKGTDGKRHIVLCGGTGCLSSHSKEIMEKFEEVLKKHGAEDMATVNLVGCFGFCSQGPFVKIYPEDTLYRLVKIEDVEEIVKTDILGGSVVERLLYVEPGTTKKVKRQDDINFYKKQRRVALTGCGVINPENVEEAMGMGAFQGMKRALSMSPQEVIDEVLAAGLRGRGGGGFPSGRKWQFAKNVPGDQKYVICNGDEGDPGAFMDRSILEGNPLAVIEGMVIAGYAIGAHDGYFYVRAEYPIAVKRLRIAIEQAKKHCLLGKNILGSEFEFNCHIRLGAGAFVCGEETALINSIEGKRGMPRPRPPFPAVKGLWQKPSIVNNVETLACVPYILREGAAAFASVGTEKSKGTKVFALGGKVNNVGLVEVPMGTTLRELIYDIGGGIPNGKKFKAIQTGGPSGGCLTTEGLHDGLRRRHRHGRRQLHGRRGEVLYGVHLRRVLRKMFSLPYRHQAHPGDPDPHYRGQGRDVGSGRAHGAGGDPEEQLSLRPGTDRVQPGHLHADPFPGRVHCPHRGQEVPGPHLQEADAVPHRSGEVHRLRHVRKELSRQLHHRYGLHRARTQASVHGDRSEGLREVRRMYVDL